MLFPLGRLVSTPAALELMARGGVSPLSLVQRHLRGDYGEVDEDSELANREAVREQSGHVLSEYLVAGERVWVSTLLADEETYTTLLLPEEY